MRILLDENLPVQLKLMLPGHEVHSVNDSRVGWKNIRNGELLKKMDGIFDLLMTADRNIYEQQSLTGRRFSIIVLPTNRRRDVLELTPVLLVILEGIAPGQYVTVHRDGSSSYRTF